MAYFSFFYFRQNQPSREWNVKLIEIMKNITGQLIDRIYDESRDQIENEVKDEIQFQVDDQIWDQIWDQVYWRTTFLLFAEIKEDIKS